MPDIAAKRKHTLWASLILLVLNGATSYAFDPTYGGEDEIFGFFCCGMVMLPPLWGFLALLLRPYGSIHWASAASLTPIVWWSVSRPSGERPDAFAAAVM